MSEGGDAGVDWSHQPTPFPTGALHRPAPAGTPLLRAGLPLGMLQVPKHCEWYRALDLRGDDGQPDALGNLIKPNCVVAGSLRMAQLWAHDGFKPTEAMADALFPLWGGTAGGIWTDDAFAYWAKHGVRWDDQQMITATRVLVDADGIAPDLRLVRAAIFALGGVGFVFRMPENAFTFDRWVPGRPSSTGKDQIHFVPAFGFDESGDFIGYSWGRLVTISPTFIIAHTIQANAFVSAAWVHPDGQGGARTPSGLTLDQLHAIAPSLAAT